MKAQTSALTERQQDWLTHIRACEEAGQSMKAYAQAQCPSFSHSQVTGSTGVSTGEVIAIPLS
jgi:hypothetical protein